jgi:hypothetical protein
MKPRQSTLLAVAAASRGSKKPELVHALDSNLKQNPYMAHTQLSVSYVDKAAKTRRGPRAS